MRVSVIPMLAIVSLAITGCDEPLTGPSAEKAYADATTRLRVVPGHAVVFVDDRRLAAGERLDQLRPEEILRVEVLKGEAAASLYGSEARGGVVRIYTKPASVAREVR